MEVSSKEMASGEKLTREETFSEYGIKEAYLFEVYALLEQKAIKNGVTVEYANLTTFSEDDFYKNYTDDETHQKHAETARSDGKTLLLEESLKDAGGIQGRLYDLIH